MPLIMDLAIVKMAVISAKLISISEYAVGLVQIMCIAEERGRNKIGPFILYTQCCSVFEQQKWLLSAVKEVFKILNNACVSYA